MIEQWLNEPDYDTAMAHYECKVLFGARRKDGKPMTEADSDAITESGIERDEEVENEDDDEEMCFYVYVEFELSVYVEPREQPSNDELKEYISDEEANDQAVEEVLSMLGDVHKRYDFEWYDFDYYDGY